MAGRRARPSPQCDLFRADSAPVGVDPTINVLFNELWVEGQVPDEGPERRARDLSDLTLDTSW